MTEQATPEPVQYVQYLNLALDPAWRRLADATRREGRCEFAERLKGATGVTSYTYSSIGLKRASDLVLWWKSEAPELLQETLAALLQTGLGQYLEVSSLLWGLTRPSQYTKRRTTQEQAVDETSRLRYLIVYPFVKTADWYLMSRDARQGMMNEHMRVGHDYADIRQVLLYTTGLDDQEFIVAYETDDLPRFQQLVIDLRATEARRYTLRDTPITTAIYRPLEQALALLG